MTEQQDVPSTDLELFTGTQAGLGKSQGHRVFFKRDDKLVVVKGDYILGHLEQDGDEEKIFAKLFTYAVEGPPYTPREEDPNCLRFPAEGTTYGVTSINAVHALDDAKIGNVLTKEEMERQFQASMQAIADAVAESEETGVEVQFPHPPNRAPSGASWKIVWEKVPEGAPEYEFAQDLVNAYATYDDLLAGAENYTDWQAKHKAWLGISRPVLVPQEDGTFSYAEPEFPSGAPSHREALSKVHGRASLDMVLRLRAQRSEHWVTVRPNADELQADRDEEARVLGESIGVVPDPGAAAAAAKSLAEKLEVLFTKLSPGEMNLMGQLGALGMNPAAAAGATAVIQNLQGEDPTSRSLLGKLTSILGSLPPASIPRDLGTGGFALPPMGGDPNFPFQDPEWLELTNEQIAAVNAGQGISLTQEQLVASESASRQRVAAAQGYGSPNQAPQDFGSGFSTQVPSGQFPPPPAGYEDWVELQPGMAAFEQFGGMSPHLQAAFPHMGGSPSLGPQDFGGAFGPEVPGAFAHLGGPWAAPFAPGPDETFTLGAEERGDRQLEAAVGEADSLRARLHADANERKRKLSLFRDVLAGGLHWALEKIEGKPEPVPQEPVGPVEQIWGRTGVNGRRAGVMQDLQEQLGAFTRNVRVPARPLAEPLVGVPGELF